MSQVVFDTTTTKGQALTGINANFTEVYGDLVSLGTMASQDADGVNIGNGSAVLSNLTCGNVTITGGTIAGVAADLSAITPILPPSPGSSQNPLTDAPLGFVSIKRDGVTYAVPCYASL